MIIDFHTHTFPESISKKTLETLSKNGHVQFFTDATESSLKEMMKISGVDYSVSLPVMTKEGQVFHVNEELIEKKEDLFKQGIIVFGGLHPAYADYKQEILRLKKAGVKGIKLHPAFQGIHINNIAYKRIIESISDADLITIVHCGIDVGFIDQNFASVPELLEVIREVQPKKFVLAHMGGWQMWDDVERDLAGAPVWLDTAYSLGPVYPRKGDDDLINFRHNLTQNQFVRLSRRHGIEHVLFATDCPWAKQYEYVNFINGSEFTEKEKSMIFSENAVSLLGLDLDHCR